METWRMYFHDQQHELEGVVENHFDEEETAHAFKMTLDGVVFIGDSLDDWELADGDKGEVWRDAQQKFKLLCYGSADKGYTYWLQAYTLTLTIPTVVFDRAGQQRLDAEMMITLASTANNEQTGSAYYRDGEKLWPDHSVCQAAVLTIGTERFTATALSPFLEIPFSDICAKLSGKYYLCNCFGCRYSDYSPYGQDNIGTLYCFVEQASIYLAVNGKYSDRLEAGQCTIWEAFEAGGTPCQETGLCARFAPRSGGLGGYRGLIYRDDCSQEK